MTWWPFSHPIDNIWSSSILHQYEFWKSIAFAFWSTIQHSFDDNVFSNKLSVSDTLSYFSVYLCNAEFSFTLGSVFGDEKTEKCKKFPKLGGGGRGVGIPTGGHNVFHRDVDNSNSKKSLPRCICADEKWFDCGHFSVETRFLRLLCNSCKKLWVSIKTCTTLSSFTSTHLLI